MKKTITFIGVFLALAVSATAQEISVTSIKIEGNMANVVINEVIEINEIEISGDDILFPAYIRDSGEREPVVRFRTREAREVVAEAIRNNRPSREPIRRINYRITRISPFSREDSSLKAFSEVTFNGVIDIDVRIMERQRDGDLWVSWPARAPNRAAGERSWVDQVSIINRRVKEIVENDLLESYEEALTAGPAVPDVRVSVSKGSNDTPITVTNIEVERMPEGADLVAVATIDLNHSIRIFDVKVYERRGQIFLEFPVSISDTGREYEQMRIFSRPLRNEIRRSVESGQPSEEQYAEVGFEISKFDKFDRESSLKYFCAVTFNQAIEIECVIIDGPNYNAFVSWPSERDGSDYIDQISIINRDVRDAVENALLERYNRSR